MVRLTDEQRGLVCELAHAQALRQQYTDRYIAKDEEQWRHYYRGKVVALSDAIRGLWPIQAWRLCLLAERVARSTLAKRPLRPDAYTLGQDRQARGVAKGTPGDRGHPRPDAPSVEATMRKSRGDGS